MSKAPQRDMLAHRGARTRVEPPQPSKPDALTVAFVILFATGLVAIALAMWLVFTLPQQGDGRPERISAPAARLRDVVSTRDAQQAEIARLNAELAAVRLQLATPPTATPTPHAASTNLNRPPLALVLDAPVYKQGHSLSCESSAAAMAANFYGVSLGEETVLAGLPRHDNPYRGFRGNVDGPYGGIVDYGVYAEPIRLVLANWGLQVAHLRGGIDEIRAHIRQERVVIAWITFGLQVEAPAQVTTSDGQLVTLVPYEHAVLVTGYNRDGLWVNDPYAGNQAFYPQADFVRSFAYLGNMGLVVGPPAKE